MLRENFKSRICLRLTVFVCFFAFAGTSYAQDSPREFEIQEGNTTYVMKQYIFVMLKAGDNRTQDSLTTAHLQNGHMAHIEKLAQEGKVVIAGPFGDDGHWRGILLFDVATIDEAIELASEDPAVKAGRLSVEAHPWWGAKGTVLK